MWTTIRPLTRSAAKFRDILTGRAVRIEQVARSLCASRYSATYRYASFGAYACTLRISRGSGWRRSRCALDQWLRYMHDWILDQSYALYRRGFSYHIDSWFWNSLQWQEQKERCSNSFVSLAYINACRLLSRLHYAYNARPCSILAMVLATQTTGGSDPEPSQARNHRSRSHATRGLM